MMAKSKLVTIIAGILVAIASIGGIIAGQSYVLMAAHNDVLQVADTLDTAMVNSISGAGNEGQIAPAVKSEFFTSHSKLKIVNDSSEQLAEQVRIRQVILLGAWIVTFLGSWVVLFIVWPRRSISELTAA
jgi:hypothetical protein